MAERSKAPVQLADGCGFETRSGRRVRAEKSGRSGSLGGWEVWGSEEAMDEITKFFFFEKNDLDGAACHFFENTYEKKKFSQTTNMLKHTVSDVKPRIIK